MPADRRIVFTEYARMRMHQRDIGEGEARVALAASSSRHRRRKDGRSEVTERFGRRTLLVVYRYGGQTITVINAMWK
ncbi:MAG: hypothetical protein HY874_02295 [Chloroflexi bacterium]|nr:hypothetical protein [Chloroflexota bacterium]